LQFGFDALHGEQRNAIDALQAIMKLSSPCRRASFLLGCRFDRLIQKDA
jgi:hypothetical protein